MKCVNDNTSHCDNVDLSKCQKCLAPMLCMCKREECIKRCNEVWKREKAKDSLRNK
jgi:hypothetical protein